LRALLVFDFELRSLLLDAAIATLNHMVDGDVSRFKHSVKVEGRWTRGMHRAGDPEGLPAAIAGRLNLQPEGLRMLAQEAAMEAIKRPEAYGLILPPGDISEGLLKATILHGENKALRVR
jgi:hypothetical protein